MSFWPDEGISPEVITYVGADVSCKMVAAHVIGAASEVVAVELGVEAQVLATNSSHHIAAKFFAKFASVDGVEIVKDRPIGSRGEETGIAFSVECLMRSPGNLATEAQMVLQNKEAAEAGIKPSTQGRENVAIAVRR